MNADTDHDTEPGGRWLLVAAVALMASALTLVMLGESEWPMFALGLGGLMVGRYWASPTGTLQCSPSP
jgi:predicted anti-sigma-YlaC factor YlaD